MMRKIYYNATKLLEDGIIVK